MFRIFATALAALACAAAQPARRGPVDLDSASIYQVWLRSFTPEGTLRAAAARLPHIAALGATIVYLSPIQTHSHAGGYSNPYRLSDYDKVDPEYGTEDDLRAFVAAAHKLNLRVLMDIVFYHTGPDSTLMAHPEFYMRKDGKIVLGQWQLPRPDFSNAALRAYLAANLVHWVRDCGMDGFRCDVSSGVPLAFWEQARAELDKVRKDVLMLGESDRPEEQLRAFDMSYNFAYLTSLQKVFRSGEPATEIRRQWEDSHRRYPDGAKLIRASDNHDQKRAIVDFGENGARAAAVMNFTMDGIPFLYNGQEIGDTVATDHQSHYSLRWEIDKPGGMTGSGLASGQKAAYAWYQSLFRLRAEEAALHSPVVQWTGNSTPDSVISYVRGTGEASVLVVINASNRKISGTAASAAGAWRPLIEGRGDSLTGGRYDLGPFGYVVCRRAK
jgi:glycosidase